MNQYDIDILIEEWETLVPLGKPITAEANTKIPVWARNNVRNLFYIIKLQSEYIAKLKGNIDEDILKENIKLRKLIDKDLDQFIVSSIYQKHRK